MCVCVRACACASVCKCVCGSGEYVGERALEAEQVALRTSKLKYTIPDACAGDVAKVTYWESMTCKTESTFQGVTVFSLSR